MVLVVSFTLLVKCEKNVPNKWVFSWSFSEEKIRVYEVRQMSILCVCADWCEVTDLDVGLQCLKQVQFFEKEVLVLF